MKRAKKKDDNLIIWKRIFYWEEINDSQIGYGAETWESKYGKGKLVRHVHYELSGGDKFNRIETMVFVK